MLVAPPPKRARRDRRHLLFALPAVLLACGTAGDSPGSTMPPVDTAPDEPAICGQEGSERRWCASCAELLAAAPGTPDGPVTISTESGVEFDALCEMDLAGGGWTLAGTNAWGEEWSPESVLTADLFGAADLDAAYKGEGFTVLPFRDLLFENDEMYASYDDVGDGTASYYAFQLTVPEDNCGIDTPYEWEMTEGTLEDEVLCRTSLYINVKDWEGGVRPCDDWESASGPAWSGRNKEGGCPLNDPVGSCFAVDWWDYNPWGDHDPEVTNIPLRMWVR